MSGVFQDAIASLLSPISDLLKDPSVSEIMINGPFEIFIEKKGLVYRAPNKFPDDEALMASMRAIAQSVGRVIDADNPRLDARLPDGSRIAVVIPPVVSQGTQLINSGPALLSELKNNSTIADLNNQFGIIDTLQSKLKAITADGTLIISAFGGVIGVGKSVLSGTFTALTVLILTLYFITSLPQMVDLGVRFVPASRRDRVSRLVNAVISRVGSFVGSQIVIAFMASAFVLALSLVLALPSPIAIAMIVLVCGLIPLIGHFIGCSVVTIIALTQSVSTGLIAFVAYVVYVQVENYLVTPRIMKRTLAVPGAVTIISALIGSSLLGLIGGLLAVPVAASIILILDEVVFPRADNS